MTLQSKEFEENSLLIELWTYSGMWSISYTDQHNRCPKRWWSGLQKRLEGLIVDYVIISQVFQKLFWVGQPFNKNGASVIIKMRA